MRALALICLSVAILAACKTAPAVPAAAELPAGSRVYEIVEATIASTDGVPIHYQVEGHGAPTLVFVHGWSCDRGYWAEQVEHFSRDHQVVTLDLAGHGESGRGRQIWTMAAFGQDVRAVVGTMDLRQVVLIGHSMGGAVILEAAHAMPGRVVGLVGVDTFHDVEQRLSPREIETFMAPWEKDFAAAARGFAHALLPPRPDPALASRIEA
ncbi:MAG: alpha/beta hydrolase, partial [Acidobacteriota bacterium]|nr:alpha/beta hydrolase [Acidobacteriota bacterium]